MNSTFIYDIPTKVYFGENQLCHLGEELSQYGKKVLLLTYAEGPVKTSGLYDKAVSEIKASGLEIYELADVAPNPRVSSVNAGADLCKKEGIDVLLAIGGGSVIDCAKFISVAAFYDGDAWDISVGNVKAEKHLPVVSITTMAATGSEMDSSAVISNPETNQKVCSTFPQLQPRAAFMDPTNTFSVPAFQTASGSADILSHVMETYFDLHNDLYMLDTVMEGLMKTVIKYAPIALQEPDNYEARANLMWASTWAINGFLFGGKPLSWSCHPIEHELSAFYDITHGLGLAIITPRWMKYMLNEKTAYKFYQFGVNVFGIDASLPAMEVGEKAIQLVEKFFYETLGLKSTLTEVGIDETHFSDMAKQAVALNDTEHMFIPMTEDDIVEILKMSL
jgi:hypothetical protein